MDSAGFNFGSNTLIPNRPLYEGGSRLREHFYNIGSGRKARAVNGSFLASYEIKENLFIDGSALYRVYVSPNSVRDDYTTMFTLGIRWNMFRREYDY